MRPNILRRDNNLEEKLATAERLISKWDTKMTSTMLFQSNRPEEAGQYLAAVDNLQQVMEYLSVEHSCSAKIIQAERLMKMSMARLGSEFHKILLCNSDPIDPDRELLSRSSSADGLNRLSCSSDDDGGSGTSLSTSTSIDTVCEFREMVSLDAVVDMRNIVQRMASTGYGRECVRVFVLTRKSVVEESFYNLGVEKVSLHDVHKMEWAILEAKIKKWIYAAKISIRLLFSREKRLCDQVFEGFAHMRDSCFAEIAKEPTGRLLGFAEAVAATRRTSEKMFRVLDIYDTLTDLQPDMEHIYCEEPCRNVQAQAAGILARLGEAARGILAHFENSLEKENSKAPIPGGTIHPLTRYVVNYLRFLLDYKETLIILTKDTPMEIPKLLPEGFVVDLHGASGPLSIRVGWIIVLLQCKLDTKSKLYKDAALSCLFLMNNLHYIVQKVKTSELKFVLGEEWLRKQCSRVRDYAANYERAAWSKVLSGLTEEGIAVVGGSTVSQQALRDRIKGMNLAIEEVMKRHCGWVVEDAWLRKEMGRSIREKLIAAYRSFVARFGRQSDMYIKYTAEELERFVLTLFKIQIPCRVQKR